MVIRLVGFKTWLDYNRFMQTYAVACCQNCRWFPDSAMNNGQFICMGTTSPVRLDMIQVCVEWENDGKNIDDYDRDMFPFKFSEKVWEKLVTMDVDLTFEELKEIIEDEEH